MEFAMRSLISYTALGIALAAGVSVAQAQTVVARQIADQPVETVTTREPGAMVIAQEPVMMAPAAVPVETVETVRTSHSTRRPVHRVRARNNVTTSRTTVSERVIPAPVAPVAPVAAVAPAYPGFYDVVTPAPIGAPVAPPAVPVAAPAPPAYPGFYDVVTPAPIGAPVAPPAVPVAAPAPSYGYVYEPGRILVIDPYTNIAVHAIPR
jgi:hypothetical protein